MKYLILLVLLFDGTLIEERLKFNPPTNDCFGWGQDVIKKMNEILNTTGIIIRWNVNRRTIKI